MTYGLLLLIFVVTPIIALTGLLIWERQRRHAARPDVRGRPAAVTLLILMAVATAYTFPWDNHLIATRVWWYNPALVSGATIANIPLEELLFFPLQTLLVGLWAMWLALRLKLSGRTADGSAGQRHWASRRRVVVAAVGAILWLLGLAALMTGWRPGTYVGWELAWAIPPLLLQALLGGDILWRQWRLVAGIIAPVTLYLSCVDALAIHAGIWTIDPRQSLGVLIFGVLPLEELLFFALTSTLVACGMTLGIAAESRERVRALFTSLRASAA